MQGTYSFKIPAKVIVSGEHAVVYGNPALVAAVNVYSFFEVLPCSTRSFFVNLNDKTYQYGFDEAVFFAKAAREKWEQSKRDDTQYSLTLRNGEGFKIVLGEALSHIGEIPTGGIRVTIRTDVEPGSGLGHSAAFSAGIAYGVGLVLNKPLLEEDIFSVVQSCEERFHGTPSGVDQEAILHGGMIRYQNRRGEPTIQAIQKSALCEHFYLIDTGRPKSSTGEVVKSVGDYLNENSSQKEAILRDFNVCTQNIITALRNNNESLLSQSMTKNHLLLSQVGASSRFADELVTSITSLGGAGKITGAGTSQGNAVGMLLVFHHDRQRIKDYLLSEDITHYPVALGISGMLSECAM
ncbi:hypothetical protein KKH43_00525 [Patescibacteria group bacterium]|nr:hypothetical protein [Patescibacteria group bacterium]